MTYKPFNKELYDRNNMIAIQEAAEFLIENAGYHLTIPLADQKEKFKDYDFVINNKDGRCKSVEVEVKEIWTESGKWQTPRWKTIDIPFRKKDSKADFFIMFNKPLDTFAGIDMKKILNSDTYIKNTKYTKGEKFFAVHVDKFKFYYKTDKSWRRL